MSAAAAAGAACFLRPGLRSFASRRNRLRGKVRKGLLLAGTTSAAAGNRSGAATWRKTRPNRRWAGARSRRRIRGQPCVRLRKIDCPKISRHLGLRTPPVGLGTLQLKFYEAVNKNFLITRD